MRKRHNGSVFLILCIALFLFLPYALAQEKSKKTHVEHIKKRSSISFGKMLGRKIHPVQKQDGITKDIQTRKTRGRDGSFSTQIFERQNGELISRTHKVFKEGMIIHQHQNHVGKYNGERQFPEVWTGTEMKNAPYQNQSPRFKPERIPGGRTFR